MPDIIGLELAVAEECLREAGVPYIVRETRSPAGPLQGPNFCRVIGQKQEEGQVILTVCRIPDPFALGEEAGDKIQP